MSSKLALLGGEKTLNEKHEDLFKWPALTKEDEDAVVEVIRKGSMSGRDITEKFEEEYAKWQGTEYGLGFNNGTGAIQSALFGMKVGTGDEVIAPSVTYWASCLPVFSLGATVVFADIEPDTLCIDPKDIEKRITDKTKAIIVVHYVGYPADMDAIMAIAKKHNIKVLEDVSHAHGGMYKGKMLGSIGDAGAMSLMSGKSFAVGEAGMLVTDNKEIYERATAWGHYARFGSGIENEEIAEYRGLPMGGYKYRMHQCSSAVGRVRLRHYDERNKEILKAMNYFWDVIEESGVKGIYAHRPKKGSNCEMGGWYSARGLYKPEDLEGLSVSRFCEAVRAEGLDIDCSPGINKPLHKHNLFQTCDIYNVGKPTRIANSNWDVREGDKSLPVSETICERTCSVPWFKNYDKELIEEYAQVFIKVINNYKDLLDGDQGNEGKLGGWHFFSHK